MCVLFETITHKVICGQFERDCLYAESAPRPGLRVNNTAPIMPLVNKDAVMFIIINTLKLSQQQ